MSSTDALGYAHATIDTTFQQHCLLYVLPASPCHNVTTHNFGACHNYVYSLQAHAPLVYLSLKMTEKKFHIHN